jgi:hypothetical protein
MNTPGSSLSQFIEEYPLYSRFGTDQPIEAADLDNFAFNFFCQKEKEVQPFRLTIPSFNGNDIHASSQLDHLAGGFTGIFNGVCQSCGEYKIVIVINSGHQEEKPRYFIRKIGQYPAPELTCVRLPKDMIAFLHPESLEFYAKGLKNMECEQGAGALVYFQRTVKNEINRIIDVLANPYSVEGNKILEAFSSYRAGGQKIKFIEEVTSLLPGSLKEHGANILLMLHEVAEIRIGELAEKECLRKSKDIDLLLRYMIRKIHAEINGFAQPQIPGKYFLRYS